MPSTPNLDGLDRRSRPARSRSLQIFASAVAFAALAAPSPARAEAPISRATEYSPYELETIDHVLAETRRVVEPSPEGKTIGRIETYRLEVLEPRDPVPDEVAGIRVRALLNDLHATTRDYVVRREMLLREGDRYLQILADETARNMRARMPYQVSVILIVPVRGRREGEVDLLVVTKDIWSLRLSYDIAVTRGGVERFVLVPQETNLFGRHHTMSTYFQYLPESLTFGAGYQVPRFGASWIGAQSAATAIVNRRSGDLEGAAGSMRVGQDLYSTRTPWAWSANASASSSVLRRYVNAQLATYDSPLSPDLDDGIPTAYRARSVNGWVGIARSFGWGLKNNVGLSFNVASNAYRTGDLSMHAPAVAADFVNKFVPIGETRVYPALTWATFQNDYLRTLDVNTLALQEDYRLGHDVSVSVYPVTRALGSTRTFLGITAKAGYTVALGDGFASASVATVAENQDGTITDGSVSGTFVAVTPRFGLGRVVMSVSALSRYRNYLRQRTFTGGDDRMRGYPSNFFVGKDTVFYNLEYRSRSVTILKCQLGGVVFYDVGDAADGFDAIEAKQSVGAGLRLLIPQLNRVVFRFDVAAPLVRGPFPDTGINTPVNPVAFFFGFNQAFGTATTSDVTSNPTSSASALRPQSPVGSFYGLSRASGD